MREPLNIHAGKITFMKYLCLIFCFFLPLQVEESFSYIFSSSPRNVYRAVERCYVTSGHSTKTTRLREFLYL